jgi:hypothetical protein
MMKYINLIFCLLWSFATLAQEKTDVEMADVMRSNGKIYVVVAVLLAILLGFIVYLVNIDRRLNNIEKNS